MGLVDPVRQPYVSISDFNALFDQIKAKAEEAGPRTPVSLQEWKQPWQSLTFKVKGTTPLADPFHITWAPLQASMAALQQFVREFGLWHEMIFGVHDGFSDRELAKGSFRNNGAVGEGMMGGANGTVIAAKAAVQVLR